MSFSKLKGKSSTRSGVLLFTKINSKPYALLGLKPSGVYTDFGGGTEEGEDAYDCTLRELKEELPYDLEIHPNAPVMKFTGPMKIYSYPSTSEDQGTYTCVIQELPEEQARALVKGFKANEEIKRLDLLSLRDLARLQKNIHGPGSLTDEQFREYRIGHPVIIRPLRYMMIHSPEFRMKFGSNLQ